MLLLFPGLWLAVIPGNFIIDSIVLIVSIFILKTADKKVFYKKHILKVYAFGMISDIIGSAYMLLMLIGFEVGSMGDELYLTLPALALSAVSIFLFNYLVTFKKTDKRLTLSLIFAVVTAPYTFLVPSSLIY